MTNTTKSAKKNTLQWYKNGSFSFLKGSRPAWTSEAKKLPVTKGQDRRHGLHGDEIITKACQTFINNELKKSGVKKTHKKLYVNLTSRIITLKNLKQKTLDELINTYRKYAFSRVTNLLPGDGNYNKAIESVRKLIVNIKNKLHIKFFSKGAMPNEVNAQKYKRNALSLLRSKVSKNKTKIKDIINDILVSVVMPSVKSCENIVKVDNTLTGIIDTTKIDIGFSDTKFFKRYNKRVLMLDTRIKRGITAEEGLTQEIHNKIIGYRPRRRKTSKAS